jgi:hypothetical protein
MMDNDDHDRVMRIIQARCADALSDDDLALISNQPDDTLPVEAADKIIEVISMMETRLEALVESLRLPPETMVEAFRRAMIDLDVEDKADVVEQLQGLVELERATHEPIQ